MEPWLPSEWGGSAGPRGHPLPPPPQDRAFHLATQEEALWWAALPRTETAEDTNCCSLHMSLLKTPSPGFPQVPLLPPPPAPSWPLASQGKMVQGLQP